MHFIFVAIKCRHGGTPLCEHLARGKAVGVASAAARDKMRVEKLVPMDCAGVGSCVRSVLFVLKVAECWAES